MHYRKLGNTSLVVSEIGLGCSGFWGDKRFADRKAIDIVLEAFELGINFFDTGSNYSNFNAEPRLGRALREILQAVPREKIVVSTKAGSQIGYAPTVADDDLYHADFSPAALNASCLKSIKNLQCGHIDVFQLHGFKRDLLNDEMFRCLSDLKSRGMVKAVGVNTHFKADLEAIKQYPDVFDMVLIDANLLQLDRFEIIRELRKVGIGVVIGTVLAQGHLVSRKIGSIRNGSFFWYLARTLIRPTTRDFAKRAAPIRQTLLNIEEMTPSQAAFSYMLENEDISACVFGTTNLNNLREVAGSSGLRLSKTSKEQILRASATTASLSR
jgi:aryl-alcohol dehydrogenase-like predicted oxidoreductase